jgi:hypothetical protein
MRLALTLLMTVGLSGCLDLGFDFDLNLSCANPGESGQFRFSYGDGSLFQKCTTTGSAVLPSGDASAVLTVRAARKNATYKSVRSSNPAVLSATKLNGAVALRSLAAGDAKVELLDEDDHLVDAVVIHVRDAERVDIPGKQGSPVLLLTGAALHAEVRPALTGVIFIGRGAGQAIATGSVVLTMQPSESIKLFELFADPNRDPTEIAFIGASPGTGNIGVDIAGAHDDLPLEVVDVGALDGVSAEPASLQVERGKQVTVRVTATRAGAAVRGAQCQWSLPSIVKPTAAESIERLADPAGADYTFLAGMLGGTGTARCWLPGSLFVDVPITISN